MTIIDQLREEILTKKQAILITDNLNRRYLTGFSSSAGVLIISETDAVLFVDARYIEKAEKQVKDCGVINWTNGIRQILEYLKERQIEMVFMEYSQRISVYEQYRQKLSGIDVTPSKILQDRIVRLRRIKRESEIALIRRAQQLADQAFTHILGFIKSGISERQIALELEMYMRKNGAQSAAFEIIAVSGPNSSVPHGVPTERMVQPGDFITMDFGANIQGYHSDMTRTVAVGQVSDEMAKVYHTVLKAQKEALAVLKNGIHGKTADGAARDCISKRGFGKYFTHGTGHGVGLDIHEAPSLSPASEDVLISGDVVTVEPGIYIPGNFGVRIEDMVVITNNGLQNLTNSSKDLIVL